MAKKMLMDASHNEEVRVAVVDGNRLDDFDSEISTKRQIKGNIYLAKIIRIEPSLQAAFVEFGGNRHGFLPFSEIHPDYYRIPVSDRSTPHNSGEKSEKPTGSKLEKSLQIPVNAVSEEAETVQALETKQILGNAVSQEVDATQALVTNEESIKSAIDSEDRLSSADSIDYLASLPSSHTDAPFFEKDEDLATDEIEHVDDEQEFVPRPRLYHYKIQEVISRRQIILVQVVKEERYNKGAALTTYLSLPGRYCVLMPNAGHRSGGVSRKISDINDRKRLRDVLKELGIPNGMSLIVRTAGQERNKLELRRDFEYLLRLWNDLRELTLKSIAPILVYEEGDLIKRAIRDGYTKEIDEILVEGDEAYKAAKAFMKMLMPSHAKRVKLYKEQNTPLFHRFQVENQIDLMMQPTAMLPSGGSIVINQTEALVAIDVNSGRATRERHIDETAVKTNLEAADEIARQLRLRDLGGLIVIDFIDMSDLKNSQAVEKRLREAMKNDRARVQIGRISQFGLLELSRQRIRPSIMETNTQPCTHCAGTGVVRSIESMVLFVLRAIESEAILGRNTQLLVSVPPDVDLYILNQKRASLLSIEARYNLSIMVYRDASLVAPQFRIEGGALEKNPQKLVGTPFAVSQSSSAVAADKMNMQAPKFPQATSPAKSRSEPAKREGETPLDRTEVSDLHNAPQEKVGGEGDSRRNRRKHFTQRRRGQEGGVKKSEGGEAFLEKITTEGEVGHQKENMAVEKKSFTSVEKRSAETGPSDGASVETPLQEGEKTSPNRRRRRNRRYSSKGGQQKSSDSNGVDGTPSSPSEDVSFPPQDLKEKTSPAQSGSADEESGRPKNARRGWLKRLFES